MFRFEGRMKQKNPEKNSDFVAWWRYLKVDTFLRRLSQIDESPRHLEGDPQHSQTKPLFATGILGGGLDSW